MAPKKHTHYHNHRVGFSYPISLLQRLYSIVFAPLLFLFLIFVILRISMVLPTISLRTFSFSYLWHAFYLTCIRLSIAYIFSLAIALPLTLLITKNSLLEHILLPVFDIIQSVPVLAFFPLIVIFFVHFHFLNGAAIFIIMLSMLWNIVFSLVGGIKVIPSDIKWAARVFNIRGFSFLKYVLIPAIFPYIITGSLLAWAQGWNIIIVAEVLHTYIPSGTSSDDLLGMGSVLVHTIASGDVGTFAAALFIMVLGIAFLNLFVWQKLLHYAERFKFE